MKFTLSFITFDISFSSLLLLITLVVSPSIVVGESSYPRLLFFTPRDYQSVYVLNERDSLTNNVKTGWSLKENEYVDFIAYIAVLDQIQNEDEIEDFEGFMFFTTNLIYCNLGLDNFSSSSSSSNENSAIFPLKFNVIRSKFAIVRNISSSSGGDRRRVKRLSSSSSSTNEASVTTMATMEATTLLYADLHVKLKHMPGKYYACVYVAKKGVEKSSGGSETRKFTHQGSANPFSQIITTKDLLPIYLVCIFYFILLCFSALFSGLNLGIFYYIKSYSLNFKKISYWKLLSYLNQINNKNRFYKLRRLLFSGDLFILNIIGISII